MYFFSSKSPHAKVKCWLLFASARREMVFKISYCLLLYFVTQSSTLTWTNHRYCSLSTLSLHFVVYGFFNKLQGQKFEEVRHCIVLIDLAFPVFRYMNERNSDTIQLKYKHTSFHSYLQTKSTEIKLSERPENKLQPQGRTGCAKSPSLERMAVSRTRLKKFVLELACRVWPVSSWICTALRGTIVISPLVSLCTQGLGTGYHLFLGSQELPKILTIYRTAFFNQILKFNILSFKYDYPLQICKLSIPP